MSVRVPYLHRRGDSYSFRMAVPVDLRGVFRAREIVRALHTQNRQIAVPRAFQLASRAHALFSAVRSMSPDDRKGLTANFTLDIDFDEIGRPRRIRAEGEEHEQNAIAATIRTVVEASAATRENQVLESPREKRPTSERRDGSRFPNLTLKTVIDEFLTSYSKGKRPAMYKKHEAVLPMFLEVVGDVPVGELKQSDVNEFFRILQALPPRWRDECVKKGLSVRQLAELDHREKLGPKTFDDTYKASVRSFLAKARTDWQDQGFPTTLTTEKIEYLGDRREGENKQRALKPDELRRLFEGPELQRFANDGKCVHQFWLPVLGLFTGARVNELCQINPQVDVIKDLESGIWYLELTDATESDESVRKSIKTGEARQVPLHNKLVELGFLDYVQWARDVGARRLFPQWNPRGGRAAANAMKWFSRFLAELDLHGVENEKRRALRGMHAFRHTLLTYGKGAGQNLRCISGHADSSENRVADEYEDETILLTLTEKKRRLDLLDFGIELPTPVLPTRLR